MTKKKKPWSRRGRDQSESTGAEPGDGDGDGEGGASPASPPRLRDYAMPASPVDTPPPTPRPGSASPERPTAPATPPEPAAPAPPAGATFSADSLFIDPVPTSPLATDDAPPADPASAPGDERSAAYEAWASRVKTHKQRKLSGLGTEGNRQKPTEPSEDWTADALFEGSRARLSEEPLSELTTVELLLILDLDPAATDKDLQRAYRNKAKTHHPDRWVTAPRHVQEEHQAQMRRIADTYNLLRTQGW